jgi:hypothetical protein
MIDAATFSHEVGIIFRAEWRRARRRAIWVAFSVGVMSVVVVYEIDHVTKLWGGGVNRWLRA